jgi:hypothetical protein
VNIPFEVDERSSRDGRNKLPYNSP